MVFQICVATSLLVICSFVTTGGSLFNFLAPHNWSAPIVLADTSRPTFPATSRKANQKNSGSVPTNTVRPTTNQGNGGGAPTRMAHSTASTKNGGSASINGPLSPASPLNAYNVVGQPTIGVQFINSVLAYYGSPASGKGQALYDDGIRSGINPAYALAFFLEESTFGTRGVAIVTHSLGNIRANPGEPEYQGYRSYASWEEGFADWYQLIARQYIGVRRLSTVDQIIPIYAPATDHNDVGQYIFTVKSAIVRWQSGHI
ncbi:MAG TPA: glucosaminidase domain-containing protein [Ktedonosporobacter sp.]|nr:glucosaminidase domain-containing protein [Ktedonosporobacter sp.]